MLRFLWAWEGRRDLNISIFLNLCLPFVERDVGDQSENQHDTILDVDFVNVDASKELDAEEGGEDERRKKLNRDPDFRQ